ncbi:MAG: hypothetical protein HQL16_06380 [Candidatus Omnitrophica bacterium]|nr:hypothetical protein [Candidatus Omnitrophota bacterium]
MALVFLMIGIVVLAFGVVGWLLYSVRAEEAKAAAEKNIVPITNFNEMTPRSPIGVEVFPSVSETLVEAPAAPEDASGVETPKPLEEIKTGEEVPKVAEIVLNSVEEQSKEEVVSDNILQLKEEIKLIREKAVVQARNALEVINKLREDYDKLSMEKNRLLADGRAAQDKDQQIIHLSAENNALKERADTVTREIAASHEDADVVRMELRRQLDQTQALVLKLEAEKAEQERLVGLAADDREKAVARVREEYQKQLDEFYKEIEVLRRESDASKASDRELGQDVSRENSQKDNDLSTLQKAVDILRDEKESISSRMRELEAVNAIQAEKNVFLQYELTKSRAQAAGLERVCENSKKQVEALSRQVEEARFDNRQLKRNSDVLETGLMEFKRLNAELVKREKLSQFEVEKNQNQIEDLEKIYSGFRSRLQKTGLREEDLAGN